MRFIRLGLAATAVAFLLGTVASQAASVAAYATGVFSSPEKNATMLADISPGEQLVVQTCSGYWCQVAVRGVVGWIPADAVGSDQAQMPPGNPDVEPMLPPAQPQPFPPRPPQPQPPRPQPPVYEGACFYSERNFGGSSFCLDEGESLNSFRTWDNRIRSVEIFGGARVDLCTDRNMFGNCVTLRSDTARLPSGIDRRASSVEVY